MTRPDQGLQSEPVRAALRDALAGRPARLEDLLARHGAVLTPRPNLKLAAAFGAEVAAHPGGAASLLTRLAAEDAAPDDQRAFLPIAAAHGWAALVRAGHQLDRAWAGLGELAADERAPVRLGTLDALMTLAVRDGGPDELVAHALGWLTFDDRELRFGAAGLVLEVLADRRIVAGVRDTEALLSFLSRSIAEVADAPRSAERSDARRRLLTGLPRALAVVVTALSAGERGRRWFEEESARAEHPQVRQALSDALVRLRAPALGGATATVDEMRKVLESSAKPLRDPTRVRPGQGRGKATRRTR